MHFNSADFEIVGFDGSASAPCDLALPLVLSKQRNAFARISTQDRPEDAQTWYELSELDQMVVDGSATKLPLPMDADHQPKMFQGAMLAYVKDGVFRKLGIKHLVECFPKERTALWRLSDQATWVIAASQMIVMDFFDVLAKRISNEILDVAEKMVSPTSVVQKYNVCQEVKDLACIGLLAAKDAKWRQNFHILDAAARYLEGDFLAVRNLFDYVVRQEFPDWSWESYESHVRDVRSVINSRVIIATSKGEPSPIAVQKLKKMEDQRRKRMDLRQVLSHGEFDPEGLDRWKRSAVQLANEWKHDVKPRMSEKQFMNLLNRKLHQQPNFPIRVSLSAELTLCLATIPFFWENPETFQLNLLSPKNKSAQTKKPAHTKKPCWVDSTEFYRAWKRTQSTVTA